MRCWWTLTQTWTRPPAPPCGAVCRMRLRPGADPKSDIGPITRPDQVDVIRDHITDALARGGTAVVGGPESVRPPYLEPIVLIDVPDDSIAVTEETFGPTLTVH